MRGRSGGRGGTREDSHPSASPIEGDDESSRSHPTPASMSSRTGALILIALGVGLAADFLANALIH
jgi:hypothetical protein